jgi:hypothetical protein
LDFDLDYCCPSAFHPATALVSALTVVQTQFDWELPLDFDSRHLELHLFDSLCLALFLAIDVWASSFEKLKFIVF